MFVRCKRRFKDGKEHRYWSVVENVRVRGGRVVQRHVLYLGEINDSQRAAWCRSIEVVEGKSQSRQMALFPEDRDAPALNCEVVKINVAKVSLHDPRQWGACWLALALWERLDLDRFWGPRLPPSRQGTRWLDILKIQACCRLIDPGSEWRLHRHWYEHSALRDLLGSDRAIADDTLYRCLDRLLSHKQDFFSFLRARWAALFDARFDVLLYDLTSTYFESDPPFEDKRRFGYSRDRRPDCVQVVIALIVMPEGFPLAYEVMPGNTADQTTLAAFLEKIERQYGRSDRIWIMDRGIPTEETLALMREGDAPVRYLVGRPKGRLTRLEKAFLDCPWQEVRQSVDVKLLVEDGELYFLVRSEGRMLKQRGMRRRCYVVCFNPREAERQRTHRAQVLAELEEQLASLRSCSGGAHSKRACELRASGRYGKYLRTGGAGRLAIDRGKVRAAERMDGKFVVYGNDDTLSAEDMALGYKQLQRVERAWRQLKGGLKLPPVYHHATHRIHAHVALTVIALLLERMAEHACGATWRRIRDDLKRVQLVQLIGPHGALRQVTEPRPEASKWLKSLGIEPPATILKLD